MKKIISICLACSFYLCSSMAHAQGIQLKPYLGVGFGLFAIKYQLNDPLVGSFSQREPTWGAFIKGGLDINEYLGAELRVGTTGNPSASWGPGLPVGYGFVTTVPSTVNTKIDNFFTYLAKLQYPVENGKIYLLLGGTTAKLNANLSLAGTTLGANYGTKTGFTYGIGGDWQVLPNTSFGIEWVEYWTDVTLSTAGSTDKGSFRGLSIVWNQSF